MLGFKKVLAMLTIASIMFFSGCSLKDPFGVGYDTSVCSTSKSFGVCGSPKDVYKYRERIRKVQNDYLKARLDTTLYFAISKTGVIQVKADREAQWERYDISEWRVLIDQRIKNEDSKIRESERKALIANNKSRLTRYNNNEQRVCSSGDCSTPREAVIWDSNVKVDLPVTKGGDLSVKYQEQGPLLVTRTRIGDIIRDQGLIQQVFVANYADSDGDLVSSHEIFIVVRNPEWVVGEKTPKNVKLEDFPTPLSSELLKTQQKVDSYQENTVRSYNQDTAKGFAAANNEPVLENEDQDSSIINNFLNK